MAERLLELHDRYPFEDLNFQDETFFTRPKDILAMAERLVAAGIDLQGIVERQLVDEGARLFVDSFDRLLAGLQKKRDAVSAS